MHRHRRGHIFLHHFFQALAPAAVALAALFLDAAALPAIAQGRRQVEVAPAAASTPYVPPRGAWARKSPAELGFDAAKLADAVAWAQAHESTMPRDLSVAHYLDHNDHFSMLHERCEPHNP